MKALVDAVVVRNGKMVYINNYEIEISNKFEILADIVADGEYDEDLDNELMNEVETTLLNGEITDVGAINWIGTKTEVLHETWD